MFSLRLPGTAFQLALLKLTRPRRSCWNGAKRLEATTGRGELVTMTAFPIPPPLLLVPPCDGSSLSRYTYATFTISLVGHPVTGRPTEKRPCKKGCSFLVNADTFPISGL